MEYVDVATGEIIRLVPYRKAQARTIRRTRTKRQMRRDAHFSRAMAALGMCVALASLCAFVAVNYK